MNGRMAPARLVQTGSVRAAGDRPARPSSTTIRPFLPSSSPAPKPADQPRAAQGSMEEGNAGSGQANLSSMVAFLLSRG